MTLELNGAAANEIVYGDSEEFDLMMHEITGTSRWSKYIRDIFMRKTDTKTFEFIYSVSQSEIDEDPYDEEKTYKFKEVVSKEKTIIIYELLKD